MTGINVFEYVDPRSGPDVNLAASLQGHQGLANRDAAYLELFRQISLRRQAAARRIDTVVNQFQQ